MKLMLILLVGALILSGCNASAMEGRMDELGDRARELVTELTGGDESATLTREQARTIALDNAGVTEEEVSDLQIDYELEDGIPHYDVHFRHDGQEYDYDIHAETGKILSIDRDDEGR